MAQIPLRDQELQLKVRKLCLADENLKGVTVAIHVTDGFEQLELTAGDREILRGTLGEWERLMGATSKR
jgi:hypothetical protein